MLDVCVCVLIVFSYKVKYLCLLANDSSIVDWLCERNSDRIERDGEKSRARKSLLFFALLVLSK